MSRRSAGLSCRAGRHGRGGFTLVEALCTLVVFGFFMGVLFATVAWGFRSFSLAIARSDVTTEARRLALFVEREMRGSNYYSVSLATRSLGADRRDGFCFVSRSDWSSPSAYNSLQGTPAWDRYFIYYATRKAPYGEFVRATIAPKDAAEVGPFPYAPFAAVPGDFLPDDPAALGARVESARVLASSVQSFEVKLLPTTQEIEFRLLLRQNGIMARRTNGDREGGTFELQYRVQPQNTR